MCIRDRYYTMLSRVYLALAMGFLVIHTKYIKKIKTVLWSVYTSWNLYFKTIYFRQFWKFRTGLCNTNNCSIFRVNNWTSIARNVKIWTGGLIFLSAPGPPVLIRHWLQCLLSMYIGNARHILIIIPSSPQVQWRLSEWAVCVLTSQSTRDRLFRKLVYRFRSSSDRLRSRYTWYTPWSIKKVPLLFFK